MRSWGFGAVVLAALFLSSCATPGAPGATPPEPSATVEPAPSGSPEPSVEPTPDPEPTRPPLAELVVSTEGLGTLQIGDTLVDDPVAGMAVFDPEFCGPEVLGSRGDPGRWIAHPDYTAATRYGGPLAFGLAVGEDDVLHRIDIFAPVLGTAEGIGIGSTEAELLSAYPDAVSTDFFATRVYVVPGSLGDLQLEVAIAPGDEYSDWAPEELDTVRIVRVVVAGQEPYTVAFSDNIAPGCL